MRLRRAEVRQRRGEVDPTTYRGETAGGEVRLRPTEGQRRLYIERITGPRPPERLVRAERHQSLTSPTSAHPTVATDACIWSHERR